MKRQRFWKLILLLAVLLLPLVLFAQIRERNSWRPRTIATMVVEPGKFQFSPDGHTLVFYDDGLYICDVASATQRMRIETGSYFCFIENGKYLAAPLGENVKVFSVWDGKTIVSGPKGFTPQGVLADESTLVGGMYADGNRKLYRWNWRSNDAPRVLLHLPKLPEGPLRLLPDKATLTDGEHFWDLTGKLRFKIPHDARIANQINNPSSFIAFSDGKKVQIWNYKTGKLHGSVALAPASGAIISLKVSPDGTMLAELARTTAGTAHVNLWDIPGGRLLRQIEVPQSNSGKYVMALSPDGCTLAVIIAGSVKLWRIK